MTIMHRRHCTVLLASAALTVAAMPMRASGQSQARATRPSVVFQVSDADPAKWGLALNNLRSLQAELGADATDVELVVFGPGIGMLKADSPVGARVASALQAGVKVSACQNTMQGYKLTPSDMLPDIGYVPSGVVEIVRRQQQGWSYLRP